MKSHTGGGAAGEQRWVRSPFSTFWCRKTLLRTDVFNITCDIGDIRTHISCLQTTQELPKKHHEAGPPEQLPTGALSQIDYGQARHCEDCKEVRLC